MSHEEEEGEEEQKEEEQDQEKEKESEERERKKKERREGGVVEEEGQCVFGKGVKQRCETAFRVFALFLQQVNCILI